MALTNPFTGTEVDAKSPMDEDLWTKKVKENLEGLDTRLTAVEGGGGGGGGGDPRSPYGELLMDPIKFSNEGIMWQRRFSPMQTSVGNGSDPDGFTLYDDYRNEMWIGFQNNNNTALSRTANSLAFNGEYLTLAKSDEFYFKLPKQANFFALTYQASGATSNGVEFKIDNQTPTTLGLTDINRDAAPNSITTISGGTNYQQTSYFFGLDTGREQVVEILNNDSGSNNLIFDSIIVGYRSPTFSQDLKIKVRAGKGLVRGSTASWSDTELTFSDESYYGRTDAIVSDTAGVLSTLKGQSGGMAKVRHEETVAFSGAVTTLPITNATYFQDDTEDSGFCMMSDSYGNNHICSYDGITTTTIQAHSLDSMLFQSQPHEDIQPMNAPASTTGGANQGDIIINRIAGGGFGVTSSNNKIDFKLTEKGGTINTFAATLDSGRMSADLVEFDYFFNKAMQAAKPIEGRYFARYDETSGLWTLGVDSEEVSVLEFLFSSGANQANSVHGTLGFPDTDVSAALSYVGSTEVKHKAVKVYHQGHFQSAYDPQLKVVGDDTSLNTDPLEEELGFPRSRTLNYNRFATINTDEDCCGVSVTVARKNESQLLWVSIDDEDRMFIVQPDQVHPDGDKMGTYSFFLTFPRGSRQVTFGVSELASYAISAAGTDQMVLMGFRQYYTRPAEETVELDSAIMRTYDIAPISMIETIYTHQGAGGVYSPDSNDNVNTVTESGSWIAATKANSYFGDAVRRTTTPGDYHEVDFTLQGDGGGIFFHCFNDGASSVIRDIRFFLSASAINTSTDLIMHMHPYQTPVRTMDMWVGQMGLPAGTYKARIDFNDANTQFLFTGGFKVVDTIVPTGMENLVVTGDAPSNEQGLNWARHTKKHPVIEDRSYLTPDLLERSGYNQGLSTFTEYAVGSTFMDNTSEGDSVRAFKGSFFQVHNRTALSGSYWRGYALCRKAQWGHLSRTDLQDSNVDVSIDGVDHGSNMNAQSITKNGPTFNSGDLRPMRVFSKHFELSGSMPNTTTFNMTDTRGIKVGDLVQLVDSTTPATEIREVTTVTAGVSVNFAATGLTIGNVDRIRYFGFHNLMQESLTATNLGPSVWEWEPLQIERSKHELRRLGNLELETVTRTFKGVANGADLFYPVHSDGVPGTRATSEITILEKTSGSATWNFPEDLTNISISAGTLDLKITSRRMVPKKVAKLQVFNDVW